MKLPPYHVKEVLNNISFCQEIPWNIKQINAPSFWPHSRGGGVIAAVIDTGLDIKHPEISGRVVGARSFVGNNIYDVTDIEGHGTHVACIIAGRTCGVAPEARIMPLKVFGDNKVGEHIYDAFMYILNYNKTAAEKDKVRVINCSFSGPYYDVMMAYAIRNLINSGVSVVVSAGNSGDGKADTNEVFSFPAYIYECITIAASNMDETVAGYSNSFDGIDLMAPGTDIYSAWPGGGYKLLSGTSMSSPHVVGAISCINDAIRKREGSWPTEDQVMDILLRHVRKVNINPFLAGAGLLDLTYSEEKLFNRAAKEITLWVGKTKAVVDGKEVKLDQPPMINFSTNRTVVPLRFIAEYLGYKVRWEPDTKRIDINIY
jgi:major intracellular serine protease